MPQSYELGADDDGRRLDRILRKLLSEHSLGEIQALFRKKRVKLNGKRVVAKDRGYAGDQLLIFSTELSQDQGQTFPPHPRNQNSEPGDSSMQTAHEAQVARLVVFESPDLLILNKPRGVSAHGEHSLLPQILVYLRRERTASLSFTPGPVHRLDRNTTGLIVYAKTLQGARSFSQLLHSHTLRKSYLALLNGSLEQDLTWSDVLHRDDRTQTTRAAAPQAQGSPAAAAAPGAEGSGLAAETTVTPLCTNGALTLALMEPRTGRTHQIRAQAALHGYPLAGDSKYGAPATPHTYILHAFQLAWEDPTPQRVLAPVPPEAESRLTRLFGAQNLDELLGELGL